MIKMLECNIYNEPFVIPNMNSSIYSSLYLHNPTTTVNLTFSVLSDIKSREQLLDMIGCHLLDLTLEQIKDKFPEKFI